jgi:hypothetical protein
MDEILEPLRSGRASPMGLVLGLGLATEEYNIFPNSYPQFSYANFVFKRI